MYARCNALRNIWRQCDCLRLRNRGLLKGHGGLLKGSHLTHCGKLMFMTAKQYFWSLTLYRKKGQNIYWKEKKCFEITQVTFSNINNGVSSFLRYFGKQVTIRGGQFLTSTYHSNKIASFSKTCYQISKEGVKEDVLR